MDKIFTYHLTWKEVAGLALASIPALFIFTPWNPEWWKIPGFLLFVPWLIIVVLALANFCYDPRKYFPKK